MKKTYLNSFCARCLTLLVLALLSTNLAWGEVATMSYSGSSTGNMTGGNDAATVGLDAKSWSVVGNKGGNNNFPGLNKAGQIRLYGSSANHNTITVTNLAEANITSIKVTYGGTSNCNAKVTVSGTEVTGTGSSDTEKTYAINSASFTIAHNYSDNTQVYISSIVITYESTAPARTLQSIYIDGTAEKLEYFVGDSFDPAGLKVMGKYNDELGDAEITSGITWEFNPEVFALENTSISVTAKHKDFTSEAFTVNGITVSERTFDYTYTSNVELTAGDNSSDAVIKYDGGEYNGVKCGTSSKAGSCTTTIPAATKTLHFHAIGWKGAASTTLTVNDTEYTITPDDGITGNPPFTLVGDAYEYYYTFEPNGATEITFTSDKRFAVFGVNAELLKTQKVEITTAKYATLGLPYAVTIPEGVSAYTATVEDTKVTMTKIQTGKIPANCGVILYAEAGDYTFTETADVSPIEGNKLVAVVSGPYTCGDDYGKDYYLGKDTDGSAIFKKLNLGGTIAAGKAYLKLDAALSSGAKLDVTFGEPTGITSYENDNENENLKSMTVYNLNGVRVNEAYKGIVIMNGKKYINK